MNEPFNLEQFKQGRKAITRDGRVAEFLYYHEGLIYPLGAVVLGEPWSYLKGGEHLYDVTLISDDDLTHMAPAEADPYAELKAAHAAGKVIQFHGSLRPPEWRDATNDHPLAWCHPPEHYRIKPEADPYAELKAAYAAGKTIQWRIKDPSTQWMEKTASFDEYASNCEYRIKPEEDPYAERNQEPMTNLEPPTDIIEAARQIHQWAELNGQTEYEIHGICSRKRALALEREVALLMGRLQQLQNNVRVDDFPANVRSDLSAPGANSTTK
jgi:hypothetical protein